MPVPVLDFGLFIAYVVPGFIAFYGFSFVSPQLRNLWRPEGTTPSVGAAVLVALIALALGRIVSIGRAAIVDPTFDIPLPFLSCQDAPHRGAVHPAEPDYRQMIDSGRREAFLLAIASEQRPYQFGGNTALAVLLAVLCWVIGLNGRERVRLRVVMLIIIAIALAALLYGGARVSHYRFVRAVVMLNGGEFQSFDGNGKPCKQP